MNSHYDLSDQGILLLENTYVFMIGLVAGQVSCFSCAPKALQLDVTEIRGGHIWRQRCFALTSAQNDQKRDIMDLTTNVVYPIKLEKLVLEVCVPLALLKNIRKYQCRSALRPPEPGCYDVGT